MKTKRELEQERLKVEEDANETIRLYKQTPLVELLIFKLGIEDIREYREPTEEKENGMSLLRAGAAMPRLLWKKLASKLF